MAAGDGVTDDTAAIQAVLDDADGDTVDGGGKTYAVSALRVPSNITVQNFNLVTIPAGVEGEGYSPITIGAYDDTTTRRNITIDNVHIDGQRALQDGLSGALEDGARHGFRILGPVDGLTIRNSSAVNCATDGLSLYRGQGMAEIRSYSDGIKHNILIEDCEFSGNRRHGVSGECMVGVTWRRVTCDNNGVDVAGATEGAAGAASGGVQYGCGWDIEEYDEQDYFGDLLWESCSGDGNAARTLLVYSNADVDASHVSFVPRDGITFRDSTFNDGIDAQALMVSPAAGNRGKGAYYDNVLLDNCTVNGLVLFRTCDTVDLEGGVYRSDDPDWFGVVDTCGTVTVDAAVDRESKELQVGSGGTTVVYL